MNTENKAKPKPKGRAYIHLIHSNNAEEPFLVRYNTNLKTFKSLEEAIEYVKFRISKNPYLIYRGIWDLNTGKVI